MDSATDELKVIYSGGYIPDLALMPSDALRFANWLFYKHPDGQWVSLCEIFALSEKDEREPDQFESGD